MEIRGQSSENISESTLGHATLLKLSVFRDLQKIKKLEEEGHEVIWNSNGRFCTINGETFNVAKSVYDKRHDGEDLNHPFNDIGWSDRILYLHNSRNSNHSYDSLYANEDDDVWCSNDFDEDDWIEEMKNEELVPSWVIRNLKQYGNCYVSRPISFLMEDLDRVLDFDIKVTVVDAAGLLIERVKE